MYLGVCCFNSAYAIAEPGGTINEQKKNEEIKKIK